MASLNRGDFNKRVSFQNSTKVSDGAGGYDETYSTLLTTWAMVEDKGGSRYFDNAQDGMIDRKDIYVYYRTALDTGLKTDTYILYNGKEYSIDRWSNVDEIKKIIHFEVTGKI